MRHLARFSLGVGDNATISGGTLVVHISCMWVGSKASGTSRVFPSYYYTPRLLSVRPDMSRDRDHHRQPYAPDLTRSLCLVLPGLYVGNYRDSKDAAQLEKFNITHILSIHDTAKRIFPERHYLCVLASDTPNQNLSQYFSLCNDFIHAARLRNGNVLIHCLAGMSRSVTVTTAYIMTVTDLSWKDALKVVRVGRTVANPNSGFQKQLQEFEMTRLVEERKRLKERFPNVALTESDDHHCQLMLKSYQKLVITKHLCEGNCTKGETCPTGICHVQHRKLLRKGSLLTDTQVQLPSTSKVKLNMLRRPQSGPAVLMNSRSMNRMSSLHSLSEFEFCDTPLFSSAPSTPQGSPQRRVKIRSSAPLVDLDELMDTT
ncbi:hypothetical protein PGB90_002059 [Kerria lacca]